MLIRTKITNIGDPFILRRGSRYYMYATSAPGGFLCFSSGDLLDWNEIGYCYRGSAWGENCFWAPEVYEYRGSYYLLYTARRRADHSLRIGLAVAQSPEGPFRDLKEGPLFDPGYACIDATLLFDEGAVYLYYVRDCSENIVNGVHISEIYGVELTDDLLHFKGTPVRLAAPELPWETSLDPHWQWNEGPAVLKIGAVYYLNYSVNCFSSPDYSVGCATALHPLGPFVKYDEPVLRRAEGDFSGPGHNSFFTDRKGELYTAFHIHTDPAHPSGDRRACIAPAGVDGTGKFTIRL